MNPVYDIFKKANSLGEKKLKYRKELSMMRLWHYKLLPVLPDSFIIAEWRECIAIKRQWEKGTLKHRLVSYVMDYDKSYFLNYFLDIMVELDERKIKYQNKYHKEICDFCKEVNFVNPDAYYSEHNNRYLKQCLYNLQEKWDRGILNDSEWYKIYDKFKDKI